MGILSCRPQEDMIMGATKILSLILEYENTLDRILGWITVAAFGPMPNASEPHQVLEFQTQHFFRVPSDIFSTDAVEGYSRTAQSNFKCRISWDQLLVSQRLLPMWNTTDRIYESDEAANNSASGAQRHGLMLNARRQALPTWNSTAAQYMREQGGRFSAILIPIATIIRQSYWRRRRLKQFNKAVFS